jgi:mono/diheme cytochrome c family protein
MSNPKNNLRSEIVKVREVKTTTKKIIVAGLAGGIVLSLGGIALGWTVIKRGFSARDEPSAVEVFIARRVRRMGVPSTARNLTNPVPASSEALLEAMEHFADHCAVCHANDGSGETDIGSGLYPKAPDMRTAQTQELSDGELYYIIENGIRLTGMPAFGRASADPGDSEATWKLVHFIRHLPVMTEDERIEMKDMNPKTRKQLREEEEIQRFLRGEDDTPPAGNSHTHP